jgi:hypothetical protein
MYLRLGDGWAGLQKVEVAAVVCLENVLLKHLSVPALKAGRQR